MCQTQHILTVLWPRLWEFSDEHKITINDILNKLHAPHYFSRSPRCFFEWSHWKADELRQWILYLSIPLISGRLPDAYVRHWSLFVEAYRLLTSSKLTRSNIDHAELLLKTFVDQVPELYYENHVTIKVHSLIHILTVHDGLVHYITSQQSSMRI
jgi:hypothetical protein